MNEYSEDIVDWYEAAKQKDEIIKDLLEACKLAMKTISDMHCISQGDECDWCWGYLKIKETVEKIEKGETE